MTAERAGGTVATAGTVRADATSLFLRFIDLAYPNIERCAGV